MKSKIAVLLLTIILLLTLYMLFFYNGSKSYSYELNSSNIAVMVFDETENNYIKQNSIPTGNYAINTTLSHCNGDSTIDGYDNILGKVSTTMYGDDICVLYFDVSLPVLSNEIFEQTNQTSSQNSSSWAIVNEGNGLRYEGKDPDNYVCFSDTCTDDTLYRIIGKFTEMVDTDNDGVADTNQEVVKLIKNTSSGNMQWDLDDSPYAYIDTNSTIKFVNNKITGDIAASEYEGQNNWSQASLKNYLNNNWTKPTNAILTTRWYLKVPSSSIETATSSNFLTGERNGTALYSDYWDGKVGLMYPSDYGYAVLSSSCARTKYLYYGQNSSLDYRSSGCYNQNWIYLGSDEWMISPVSIGAFYIHSSGSLNIAYVSDSSYAVRPTFYLDDDTEISGGNGSKTNPYKIAKNMISFTMNSTTYQAEEGMTWNDWINSSYNTGGYVLPGNNVMIPNCAGCPSCYVFTSGYQYNSNYYAKKTDLIVSNGAYVHGSASSCITD